MSTAEVVQVIAAVAASIAAGASWRTAAVNARNFRRSTEPHLIVQPLVISGQLHFDVYNAGGGPAMATAYMLVADDDQIAGYLALGMLEPGRRARIRSVMSPTEDGDVLGVIGCRDTAGTVWGWKLGGLDRRAFGRPTGGKDREPSVATMFDRFYPGVRRRNRRTRASEVLSWEQVQTLGDKLAFTPTNSQLLAEWHSNS